MENLETTEYPIATSHLQKGDTINAETIEAAFGVKRGTQAYQFAVMRVCDHVRQRFAERVPAEIVTVVQDHDAVVVLTDNEATEYNARRFKSGIAQAARSHRQQLGVDRSKLDEAKVPEHDRSLTVQGRVLSAINKARRMPALKPAARGTPEKLGS